MVDEMFDGPGEMDVGGPTEDGPGGAGGGPLGGGGGNGGSGNGGGAGGNGGGASGHASTLMQELTTSERTVHADFKNDFGFDFFDDKDLK